MNSRNQLPPLGDLNGPDNNHDLRFFYDNKGNLTRIRRERRMDGCLVTILVWTLLIGALYHVLSG